MMHPSDRRVSESKSGQDFKVSCRNEVGDLSYVNGRLQGCDIKKVENTKLTQKAEDIGHEYEVKGRELLGKEGSDVKQERPLENGVTKQPIGLKMKLSNQERKLALEAKLLKRGEQWDSAKWNKKKRNKNSRTLSLSEVPLRKFRGAARNSYVKSLPSSRPSDKSMKPFPRWKRYDSADFREECLFNKNRRLKENILEEEKEILSQKVRLDNGELGDVISVSYRKNKVLYGCHICQSVNVIDHKNFIGHCHGKTHRKKLTEICHRNEKFVIRHPNEKLKENRIANLVSCDIQPTFDSYHDHPLVGLEYIVELCIPGVGQYQYQCLVCADTFRFINCSSCVDHLVSKSHYKNYFKMFFPTFYDYAVNKVMRSECMDVLRSLAFKVEQVYGRLKPMRVSIEDLVDPILNIVDVIDRGPHFREIPALAEKFIDEILIPHPEKDIYDHVKVEPYKQTESVKSNESVEQSEHGSKFELNTQTEFIRQNQSVEQPVCITTEYKTTRFDDDDEKRFYEYAQTVGDYQLIHNYEERTKCIENTLLEELKLNRLNPNNHPMFKIEYDDFLIKRTSELVSRGENPSLYDFKLMFSEFWDVRLNEMFQNNLKNEKCQLRLQLKYLHSYKNSKSSTNTSPKKLTSFSYKRNLQATNTAIQNDTETLVKRSKIEVTSGGDVIEVLRHLSVLDEQLGLLGPKVNDLLYQAVKIEKTSGNCSKSILSNEENYTILQMVSEKLSGLLEAGIFEQRLSDICKTAVSNINSLLNNDGSHANKIDSNDRRSFKGRAEFRETNKPYEVLGYKKIDRKFNQVDSTDQHDGQLYTGETRYQSEQNFNSVEKCFETLNKDEIKYCEMRPNSKSCPSTSTCQGYESFNKRKPNFDKEINKHENNFFQDEKNLDLVYKNTETKSHNQKFNRLLYTRHDKVTQNSRRIKLSDINPYIENVYLNMSVQDKLSIGQELVSISIQIRSSLIRQRKTEILEDEILNIIKDYTSKRISTLSPSNLCPRDSNSYNLSVNKSSPANILRLEVPAVTALNSLKNSHLFSPT